MTGEMAVVVTYDSGVKVTQQTYNAKDFDNAVAIRNREQGRNNVKRVDVMMTIYSWSRSSNNIIGG